MTSCPVTPSSATVATSRFDWGSTMLKLLSPLLATTNSPEAEAALATRISVLKTAVATSSKNAGQARTENLAIVISSGTPPAIKVTQTAAGRKMGWTAGCTLILKEVT